MGVTGLVGGYAATQAMVTTSFLRTQGAWLIPYKIPVSILGGIVGAELITSIAAPVADFVMLIGHLAEFTVDGLKADFFGKPRKELKWIAPKPAMEVVVKSSPPSL